MMGGKWKPLILFYLIDEPQRFSALKKLVFGINERMLSRQLKELCEDGLILRTDYNEMPPRVDYRMTDKGEELVPILKAIESWGEAHLRSNGIEPSEP